jgi:hypothetical protein
MIYILYFLIILFVFYLSRKTKELFEDASDADECIDEDNKIVKLPKPKPIKKVKKVKKVKKAKYTDKKEVFLIYNKYTYNEAKEICKLYSGRLATESDMEKAFQNGANWCNWGWLEGKRIAYPVQEKYWEQVEKVHKGHCGPTAGINKLGNIEPSKKYSVNCYGIKPRKSKKDLLLDEDLLKSTKKNKLEDRIKQCKLDKREKESKKWASEQKKGVRIVGFNKYKWSIVANS